MHEENVSVLNDDYFFLNIQIFLCMWNKTSIKFKLNKNVLLK